MRIDDNKPPLKRWIITLALLVVVGYALFEAKNLLQGPSLTVLTPQNASTVEEPLQTIHGKAKRIAKIHLNGRQIYVDKNGYFTESLLLSLGYNIITITAQDQFNRTVTEKIELVLR